MISSYCIRFDQWLGECFLPTCLLRFCVSICNINYKQPPIQKHSNGIFVHKIIYEQYNHQVVQFLMQLIPRIMSLTSHNLNDKHKFQTSKAQTDQVVRPIDLNMMEKTIYVKCPLALRFLTFPWMKHNASIFCSVFTIGISRQLRPEYNCRATFDTCYVDTNYTHCTSKMVQQSLNTNGVSWFIYRYVAKSASINIHIYNIPKFT